MTDLARLKAFCPPPGEAPPTPLSWNRTEQELGHRLPSDYKRIVETYGAGKFADFLGLYQPNCPYIALDLARQTHEVHTQLVRHQEISDRPLPYNPHELQPAGITDNGDYLLWFMHKPNEPASWTLTSTALDDEEWFDFEGNLTAFLVALAQHEIDAPIFPDNLLRHTPCFTPHTAHPDDVERANRAGSAPSARPVQSDDIRKWARRSGHEVPDRGRIPAAIRKAYDDAHPCP
ncbi:histone-like nucleoid-structuring protein Lsr2 [Streptomyces decoyicus]|uniref:Lsr2 family DNA-binding protein n=1 Tax=Streptomyces decoyicus TaxID=249567 RepID=UPI00364135DF